MTYRFSPKITITLPQPLIDQITPYTQPRGVTRSAIIQQALWDWLAQQPKQERVPDEPKLVSGKPYDPHKKFTDYTRPGMKPDELLRTLMEYEAAQAIK